MTTYNINELLEKKKHLEEQIQEKTGNIDPDDLLYVKKTIIDHTNSSNTQEIIPRKKVKLTDFSRDIFTKLDELKNINTAIQKYNAENVLGKLQEREATRQKIEYYTQLKSILSTEKKHNRHVTRQGKDHMALETTEVITEPMFEKKHVEQELDKLAAQERKLNTEIQKINLNAEIKM